ncbi:MAG: TRAP transporter substrate-binding protein DctP [Geminicoccaceae bacterium]
MTSPTRRGLMAATAIAGVGMAAPTVLRAQSTVIRWGEMLPATHPQALMIDRIAATVAEQSDGRIEIQSSRTPARLGQGHDGSGRLRFRAMTTDGAAALGSLLPQLSVIEAPYLWRDAAHMAKVANAPVFAKMNDDPVAQRGLKMLAVTYYGKRHLTTGTREVRTVADMRASGCACCRSTRSGPWPRPGARRRRRSTSPSSTWRSARVRWTGENPLPTIASAKLNEVQKYLVLTGHIITLRLVIANNDWLNGLDDADREILEGATAEAVVWQDAELASQEASLQGTLEQQA